MPIKPAPLTGSKISRRLSHFFPTILILFSLIFHNFLFLNDTIYAATSPWNQTDWVNGSGQTLWNDSTKFSTNLNTNTSATGQVTLAVTSGWCNTANCNSSWKYRKNITFNNTDSNLGVTSENLIDFPVLVKLSSSNIDYTKVQDNGQDIRFTDPDGTDLSYEIEKWDKLGTSWIWVKVPKIDINSNTDYIYIYYGNASVSDHQQAGAVWTNGFASVWHMNDSAANQNVTESTANANLGQAARNTSLVSTNGQTAGSLNFNNSTDFVDVANMSSLQITSDLTVSSWINISAGGTSARSIAGRWTLSTRSYKLSVINSSGNKFYLDISDSGYNDNYRLNSTSLNNGTWYYVTGVYKGGATRTINVYLNGILNNGTLVGTIPSAPYNGGPFEIGRVGTNYFSGMIDETRVSNTARSAAWIAASYKSETAAYNTFASEEVRYVSPGTLTSSIFDTEGQSNWGILTYETDGLATASVKVRTSNSESMATALDFSLCDDINSGSDISGNNCVHDDNRYIQYQIGLTSTLTNTPTFQNLSIDFASIDSDPPNISLIAVTPDPTNDNFPTLIGTATEAIGTVSNVEFQIDGTNGSWSACTATDNSFNSNTESFSCTSSILSDGYHTINVRATDSNGNTTVNESVANDTFTIDTTSPDGGSLSYTNGYYTASSIALNVEDGTDTTTGVNTSTRIIERKSATLNSGTCDAYGSFGTITPTGSYPNFTDNTVLSGNCYEYQYKVRDNAGNEITYSQSNSAKVDTSIPSMPGIPGTTSPTNSTSQVWNWVAATDAISDIANYLWRTTGSSVQSGTTNTTSVVTNLTQGIYNFFIKAIDTAGNEGEENSSSVTVNTSAPSGSIEINSRDLYTNSTSVTLTLATEDDMNYESEIQMKVSNLADFSGTNFEAFNTSKTWGLEGTDGLKTVYVKFKDLSNNESPTYSATITLDTNTSTSIVLDSPETNIYTTNERPTFTFKTNTDSLYKYTLFVDNGNSDSFLIDNIPVSGNNDFNTSVFNESFDNTDNKISIKTKSSSEWGDSNNNGKLAEGKREWSITAYDNAKNQTTATHTLFVDRSKPIVEIEKINNIDFKNNIETNDLTPVFEGKITDNLEGKGDKVASGPKQVEIKIEKKKFGMYELHSLATINFDTNKWEKDSSIITDNTENKSDKYSNFTFSPKENWDIGDYRVQIKGIDKVDNTSEVLEFNLKIKAVENMANNLSTPNTSEENKNILNPAANVPTIITNPATQKESDKEVTVTKEIKTQKPNIIVKSIGSIGNTSNYILSSLFNTTSNLTSIASSIVNTGIKNTQNTINFGLNTIANNVTRYKEYTDTTNYKALTYVKANLLSGVNTNLGDLGNVSLIRNVLYGTGDIAVSTVETTGNVSNIISTNTVNSIKTTSKLSEDAKVLVQNSIANSLIYTITGIATTRDNSTKTTKDKIANIAFAIGEKTQNVSESAGLSIVKFGYNFISEPTKIFDVKVYSITSRSAKISWTTNHPASGKVNYGLDETYEMDIQVSKKTTHHEFILTDLKPNTQYYFEVMSQNKNYVYDANRKFTTPAK